MALIRRFLWSYCRNQNNHSNLGGLLTFEKRDLEKYKAGDDGWMIYMGIDVRPGGRSGFFLLGCLRKKSTFFWLEKPLENYSWCDVCMSLFVVMKLKNADRESKASFSSITALSVHCENLVLCLHDPMQGVPTSFNQETYCIMHTCTLRVLFLFGHKSTCFINISPTSLLP